MYCYDQLVIGLHSMRVPLDLVFCLCGCEASSFMSPSRLRCDCTRASPLSSGASFRLASMEPCYVDALPCVAVVRCAKLFDHE